MNCHGDHYEDSRGTYTRFRGKLNDCRNCTMSDQCMNKPVKSKGRQVQFLNESQRKTNYTDLMKEKIDSEQGAEIYSKRMWTIEPVFGNINSNKRLSSFSLRGKEKVSGQWRCVVWCII